MTTAEEARPAQVHADVREVADKLGTDLCDVLRRAADAMVRG